MHQTLTLFLENKTKYLGEATHLAMRLINNQTNDPGAIAYHAKVITYEELSAFCLETVIYHHALELNLPNTNTEDVVAEMIAHQYNATIEQTTSWLDEIKQRSLHYFNFTHVGKQRSQIPPHISKHL